MEGKIRKRYDGFDSKRTARVSSVAGAAAVFLVGPRDGGCRATPSLSLAPSVVGILARVPHTHTLSLGAPLNGGVPALCPFFSWLYARLLSRHTALTVSCRQRFFYAVPSLTYVPGFPVWNRPAFLRDFVMRLWGISLIRNVEFPRVYCF